jgi:hypothetical protein
MAKYVIRKKKQTVYVNVQREENMMKKSFKAIAVLVLILIFVGAPTACETTLKGTYTSREGIIEQSFTFKEDNKVEMSAFGIEVEGEYKIEDGEITITYDFFGLSYDWVKSFEKDGKSIFIDGEEFVKEK